MKALIYGVMWLFIGWVSAYDAYLNLRYPVTALTEENPLARWILEASGNDLPLFIALKFAGTLVCLGVLALYYRLRPSNALACAALVSAAQAWVLIYLTDSFTILT
jgi:hypothetical protein